MTHPFLSSGTVSLTSGLHWQWPYSVWYKIYFVTIIYSFIPMTTILHNNIVSVYMLSLTRILIFQWKIRSYCTIARCDQMNVINNILVIPYSISTAMIKYVLRCFSLNTCSSFMLKCPIPIKTHSQDSYRLTWRQLSRNHCVTWRI